METTHGVYNSTLVKEYFKPNNVFEGFRVMVATRLATASSDWVTWYEMYNDGMYSNQWMIFDYKLFTPGEKLPADTFWISE